MKQAPIGSTIKTPDDFDIDHPIIKTEMASTISKEDFGAENIVEPVSHHTTIQPQKKVDMPETVLKPVLETVTTDKSSKSSSVLSRPKTHTLSKLSDRARERRVPSTKIGRLFEYSSLAVSVSLGTAAEYVQRKVLPKSEKTSKDMNLLAHKHVPQ
ncbi:hypothetical protein JTE90_021794 [Oedothorax gibbosus]|uniref:Uncharacterized protein n=1 Tax=Oedothorax gibbosus TaxID=931172 RepID=A0AAV6TL18_9ARAC|nr:hypothetical protein JTE90_021794 [Oedothorax gibbosus]